MLVIHEGRIAEIREQGEPPQGAQVLDAGTLVVMPGLVDTHVHVNEPGRTEWEGFASATQAAAAGGVTTLIDMPLNSIPVTTSAQALKTKLAAARAGVWVDCGFWGGVVPGNAGELENMIAAGALGFKAFMIHSGIDDFPAAQESDLRESMKILAKRGVPLLVHAELGDSKVIPASRHYGQYLASRPDDWESAAIALLADLCRETGCRVHIVHLSSAGALPILERARREKLPLTAETCPHYLHFAAEDVPEGRTEFKCAPPIRGKENRERLWQALREGLIDFVVSDHSPCAPDLKCSQEGDFSRAWGGISSLQFGLPVVWTEARKRGFGLPDIARWMAEEPARFAGLTEKGRLAPGADADFILFNPEKSFDVQAAMILHRHKLTPYTGETLSGTIEAAYLRGQKIFERGGAGPKPAGRLLLNSDRRIA